jgi:hypothetical protein
MLKYLTGTALGAAIAFTFVAFDLEPPAIIKAPAKLRANLVVSAIENDIYDLAADIGRRERAFEIYLKNRPRDAVKLDAEGGHPLLNLLVRMRARNDALQLLARWTAYDTVLSQAALRAELERKHNVTETTALKQAMLFEALDAKSVLKGWLEQTSSPATPETLHALLVEAARPLDQPMRNIRRFGEHE